jgi:hypothetical protein
MTGVASNRNAKLEAVTVYGSGIMMAYSGPRLDPSRGPVPGRGQRARWLGLRDLWAPKTRRSAHAVRLLSFSQHRTEPFAIHYGGLDRFRQESDG